MALTIRRISADMIGVWASSLCTVHCLLTPLLFAAQFSVHFRYGIDVHAQTPWYWSAMDWVFLVLAFVAIWATSKEGTAPWVKWGMWMAWSIVALVVLSETLHLHFVGHDMTYVGAFGLIGLHFYNHRKRHHLKAEDCTV
ncbi:MAG: MerC domain-containing protein [Mameliella sp.]|nr:MerC domain-containing protein [Phaeodactylibacter sp.]